MIGSFLLAIGLSTGLSVSPQDPVDVLAPSHEMIQFLDRSVDSRARGAEQLEQLVKALFDDDGLGFQYDAAVTRTARETFEAAAGNCVSFSLMFLSLARHLGLNVQFQEIDLAPTWTRRGLTVLYNRHVNLIVRVGPRAFEIDLVPRLSQVRMGGKLISDERAVAHYYNNQGADYSAVGNLEMARLYYEKALEIEPQAAFVWGNLGVVLARMGEPAQAETCYLRAIELDQTELTAMENLAVLYRRMERFEDAEIYLSRVKRFRERNPYHHFNQGWEAYHRGDFKQAVEHFQDAVRRNDKDHAFFFALAQSHAQLGNSNQVRRNLERARALLPEDVWSTFYEQNRDLLGPGSVTGPSGT